MLIDKIISLTVLVIAIIILNLYFLKIFYNRKNISTDKKIILRDVSSLLLLTMLVDIITWTTTIAISIPTLVELIESHTGFVYTPILIISAVVTAIVCITFKISSINFKGYECQLEHDDESYSASLLIIFVSTIKITLFTTIIFSGIILVYNIMEMIK